MTSPVIAFIALGANLDHPIEQIRQGIALLGDLPDSQLLAASSLYRTAPFGAGTEGHPDYINAVVRIETRLDSGVLLKKLQTIEARQGRSRDARQYHSRNAGQGGSNDTSPSHLHEANPVMPRTLDLDLLLFGDARIDTAELEVPHPRLAGRAFVLVPLAEIAPALMIPGVGAILDLLPAVAAQTIVRLP